MSAMVYRRHGESSVEKCSPRSQSPWTRRC